MRESDFERLYEQHAGALLGYLEVRTGDRPTAEDLLADTFERVLRARRRFDPRRGSESAWVYSIALNCVRDHVRRRGAEARALEREAVAHARPETGGLPDVAERATLLRALGELSEDEREAIALRYGADLRIKEIARVTGHKPATVEARVYRALGKLRELID